MSEEDEKIIHRLKYYNDKTHLAKRIVELQHCIEDLKTQLQQKENIMKSLKEYLIKIKETSTQQEKIMAKYVLEYIEKLEGEKVNE